MVVWRAIVGGEMWKWKAHLQVFDEISKVEAVRETKEEKY
jgi:hypothetical protein